MVDKPPSEEPQPKASKKRKSALATEADREHRVERVQTLVRQAATVLNLGPEQCREWTDVLSKEYADREDASEKLQNWQRTCDKRVVTDARRRGGACALYICPHRSAFVAQNQREKMRIETVHEAAMRTATDEEKTLLEQRHETQLREVDDKLKNAKLCSFHLLLKYAGESLNFWYWVIDEDTQILHSDSVCDIVARDNSSQSKTDTPRGPPRLSRLEGAKNRRLAHIETLVADLGPSLRLSVEQTQSLKEMLTAEYPTREAPGKRLVDFHRAHLRKVIQTDLSTRGGHCVRYICAQKLAAKKPVLREKESLKILHEAAMESASPEDKIGLERQYAAQVKALDSKLEQTQLCQFQVMLKRQTSTSSTHWYFAIDSDTEFRHTPGVCTVLADDNDKGTQTHICACLPLSALLFAGPDPPPPAHAAMAGAIGGGAHVVPPPQAPAHGSWWPWVMPAMAMAPASSMRHALMCDGHNPPPVAVGQGLGQAVHGRAIGTGRGAGMGGRLDGVVQWMESVLGSSGDGLSIPEAQRRSVLEAVRREKMDADAMSTLTEDDLKSFGLTAMGDRRRLLKRIAEAFGSSPVFKKARPKANLT